MANEGCWVRIYWDDEFGGKSLKLQGPAEFGDLKHLPGAGDDWGDQIGSLETGPHAKVILYDDDNFEGDHVMEIGPNSRIGSIGNMDDDVDSMKVVEV